MLSGRMPLVSNSEGPLCSVSRAAWMPDSTLLIELPVCWIKIDSDPLTYSFSVARQAGVPDKQETVGVVSNGETAVPIGIPVKVTAPAAAMLPPPPGDIEE